MTISPLSAGWTLEHSYAALPASFHAPAPPRPVEAPSLVVFNAPLAISLGLNPELLSTGAAGDLFAGNKLPPRAQPLAQAYAGHQFGHFTMLGDGRAILLGEQRTPTGGLYDIQLKGAGRTPFSRGGDGRAALGPMLREYIISEAMHALGIPTTRSLAVAGTGEPVYRQETLPGAVLTRVAASHLRVGTFQYAAACGNAADLRALADYAMQRHYPKTASAESPYLAFFQAVMDRQASLVARWLHVGFIHGVMNTDNMAISGESIDYGPCAFMDAYDPDTAFSSIDRQGRYAYGNQPLIARWNLARLAEALIPLLHENTEKAVTLATTALDGFMDLFQSYWLAGMRRKLGLDLTEQTSSDASGDLVLVEDLLQWMHNTKADFTNTFADLSVGRTDQLPAPWLEKWEQRLAQQPASRSAVHQAMQAANPGVIPRNHKVEEALLAASSQGDLGPFHRLVKVLANPYDHTAASSEYRQALPSCGYQTFCGT